MKGVVNSVLLQIRNLLRMYRWKALSFDGMIISSYYAIIHKILLVFVRPWVKSFPVFPGSDPCFSRAPFPGYQKASKKLDKERLMRDPCFVWSLHAAPRVGYGPTIEPPRCPTPRSSDVVGASTLWKCWYNLPEDCQSRKVHSFGQYQCWVFRYRREIPWVFWRINLWICKGTSRIISCDVPSMTVPGTWDKTRPE